MHKPIGIVLLLSSMFFLISCDNSEAIESTNENTLPQYDLVKVDSIGIEIGDSNYVFGTIIDATYLIDGRIALLLNDP